MSHSNEQLILARWLSFYKLILIETICDVWKEKYFKRFCGKSWYAKIVLVL